MEFDVHSKYTNSDDDNKIWTISSTLMLKTQQIRFPLDELLCFKIWDQ